MVDDVGKLSWDDLRIVKAIGDAGNLARTAVAMGANPSTIFRRLARLERLLGVKLFERRRDGYVTTAMGAELAALAHRMETELVSLTNRLAGEQDVSGELRITTSDALAFHLVTPIVTDFLSVHQNVRIQVCVGNAAANLAKGEADVAIRATQKPPRSMEARKVAAIAWAAYGRRADSINSAAAPGDSHIRRWVSYSDELANLKAARFLRESVEAKDICYRINSVQGVAAAIDAGLGLGYLPCMLGDRIQTLMRIEPIDATLSEELWLLTRPELKKSRTVRAFFDFFAAAIDSQRAFIAGVDGLQP